MPMAPRALPTRPTSVVIALGVLLRDESVHPAALAGTVLVLGGAWLTSRAERRPVEAVTPS